MPQTTRVCPYSKIEFVPKRNNQVFASAKYRIAYHNEINNSFRRKLNVINCQLTKNFKIAESLLQNKNEIAVNRHFLRGTGFSFKVFTHVGMKGEEMVYGLYDIAFHKINQEEYLIYRLK